MAFDDDQSFGKRKRDQPKGGHDLQRLFDRLPPHSLEAEMSLLGSMILDYEVIGEVVPIIPSPEAFYSEAHGLIYDALVKLYDKRQSGDLVQLAEALKEKEALEGVGGAEYLIELAEAVPSARKAPVYARIVAEKHRLRQLIDSAGQIIYDAYHAVDLGDGGARTVLDSAEQSILEIAENSIGSDTERLDQILQQVLAEIEANEGRVITGLATGFYDLDEMTSGLQPGEMMILAARPSMGKTAFALNLAEQIAFQGNAHESVEKTGGDSTAPIAFFSLEMGRQSISQRLLSGYSGIDLHKMRSGQLSEEGFADLVNACGELANAPIYIDDTPGLTVMGLRAKARRMHRQLGIRCVVIDYLQLMTAPQAAKEGRQQEVSTISRQVKSLARELNIPVICLAQLNRGAEQREGHRPRMADLRESGSIEQDADVIALLHREEYYHKADPSWAEENPEKVGLAELIIAKQRNGPTGTVKLTWDSKTTRFKNYAADRGQVDYSARSQYVEPLPPGVGGGGGGGAAPFVPQGSSFGGRPRTGPVEGHRDGGGSDRSAEWASGGDDIPQ